MARLASFNTPTTTRPEFKFDAELGDKGSVGADFWAAGQAGAWLQQVARWLAIILLVCVVFKQGMKLLGGRQGGMGGEGGGMAAALKGLLPGVLFAILMWNLQPVMQFVLSIGTVVSNIFGWIAELWNDDCPAQQAKDANGVCQSITTPS